MTKPKGPDLHLNVSGMCCPVPLIRLAASVKTMAVGQVVEVIGNDPLFETSVRHFCQANNHALLEVAPGEGHGVRMRIGVGGEE